MGGVGDIASAAFPVAGVANMGASSGGGKGGKNGGGAPAAPDFNAAAEKQAQSSQQAVNAQTAANRPNQSNAWGASTTWTRDANGNPVQNQSLGGALGAAATNLEGQIANQGPLGTGDQARDQAIKGIYDQATSRLDPAWAQTEEQTRARLANQGLDPGSEAFGTEMGNLSRAKTDAYSSAMNNAIQGGTAAQQATFAENLASQNNPYTQLGSLRGYTEMPGFAAANASQPTPYLSAAQSLYGGQLQKYGADQAGKNSKMNGAAGLGGTLGAAAIMA